jgi:hypothetical protein
MYLMIKESLFRKKKVYANQVRICSQIRELYEQNLDMKELCERP